jgi:putative endonuclease
MGLLYTGISSNLARRVYEHRNGLVEGFTEEYKVHHLVYFEVYEDPEYAIKREKQIKKWRRIWKINLIEKKNPEWRDLYGDIVW